MSICAPAGSMFVPMTPYPCHVSANVAAAPLAPAVFRFVVKYPFAYAISANFDSRYSVFGKQIRKRQRGFGQKSVPVFFGRLMGQDVEAVLSNQIGISGRTGHIGVQPRQLIVRDRLAGCSPIEHFPQQHAQHFEPFDLLRARYFEHVPIRQKDLQPIFPIQAVFGSFPQMIVPHGIDQLDSQYAHAHFISPPHLIVAFFQFNM